MHWTEASREIRRLFDNSACKAYFLAVSLLFLLIFPEARAAQQPPASGAQGNPSPQAAPASSAPKPSAQTAVPPTLPKIPPPAAAHVQPRFLVVIDAAHGGTDNGARLSAQMLEKDLVLALAMRLRSALNAHGISVVTTRESDVLVPAVSRAETANHAVAAACVSLHATATGSGVHLFTSSLTEVPVTRFLPWDTAQGAYAGQSLRLSSEFDSAMAHAQIPVTLGRTALLPLDNFTCPAVAVEIAPLSVSGKVTPLAAPEYQSRVVGALAAAIEQWERDWRQQP
jgi:N-acetylmuramoyl-L-alanine amidase